MSDAIVATEVTFPAGSVTEDAQVTCCMTDEDGAFVILDRTPFHPLDHTWPDQPGDTGELVGADGSVVPVVATLMAASDDGVRVLVGADIPVKRSDTGWTWMVAHRVRQALAVGARVRAEVDAGRRAALSRGHTACHLASLALDAAVADLWRKAIPEDTLGNPDFESRAGERSEIVPDGSVDTYRLGKSLRKAGFDVQGLVETLAAREVVINAKLASWVEAGAPSRIDTEGTTIAARRSWVCALPEGTATLLCGGTHVASTTAFERITVSLTMADPHTLVMTTSAVGSGRE